jgi:hypothetical protein
MHWALTEQNIQTGTPELETQVRCEDTAEPNMKGTKQAHYLMQIKNKSLGKVHEYPER